MAVTKQTYTAAATWTQAQAADLFRTAFIDAGLMTDWFDSTVSSDAELRILRLSYDNTKTYGNSFFCFSFKPGSSIGISLLSGWDTTSKDVVGTQFVDYHLNKANIAISAGNTSFRAHDLSRFATSTSSNLSLIRYTSALDTKQSWFVVQQGTNRSKPFALVHAGTTLYPWLDLSKGIISGYQDVSATVTNARGNLHFRIQENVRRCLLHGHALRGTAEPTFGNNRFHEVGWNAYTYVGFGSINNDYSQNYSGFNQSVVALPVGKASANPAYTQDYVPVCTGVPWSPFTPTLLAADFAVYMHYANNTVAFRDRFIVTPNVEEWEVLEAANNPTLNDGASAFFLARVV